MWGSVLARDHMFGRTLGRWNKLRCMSDGSNRGVPTPVLVDIIITIDSIYNRFLRADTLGTFSPKKPYGIQRFDFVYCTIHD